MLVFVNMLAPPRQEPGASIPALDAGRIVTIFPVQCLPEKFLQVCFSVVSSCKYQGTDRHIWGCSDCSGCLRPIRNRRSPGIQVIKENYLNKIRIRFGIYIQRQDVLTMLIVYI